MVLGFSPVSESAPSRLEADAMLINNANLQNLRTTLELRFREGYAAEPAWWDRLATMVPSASGNNTYGWLAESFTIREWIGARQAQVMREHSYVLPNVPFESTFKVPRSNILDDNLGMYAAMIAPSFGAALAKHPDRSIKTRVFDANPTCFDGQPFFSTAHPTFAPPDAAQTYSNLFQLDLPADDLWVAYQSVVAVRAAMRTIVGENGEIMSVEPRTLVVPPQKEHVAIALANAEMIPMGAASVSGGLTSAQNTLKGMIEPLVIPENGDDPDGWGLADTTKPIKPLLWQVRANGVFRAFDDPNDVHVFNNDAFTYGIDGDDGGAYRANAGVSLPWLFAWSNPNT